MAVHNTTIQCTADTILLSGFNNNSNGNANFGSTNPLRIALPGYGNAMDIMAFDLSSIPSDKIITNIALFFRVNNFQAYDSNYAHLENNTSYPWVIRARSVTGINFADIETTLTYNGVRNGSSPENIITINALGQDSSLNITGSVGSVVYMPINGFKIVDNKLYVGIRADSNYLPENAKMIFCHANISSREGVYVPNIVVTYEDPAAVAPTSLVPNNTVRNRLGEIKLNWQNTSTQKTFEVQYSTNGFSSYTTGTGGTVNSYTIPANVFTNGQTVSWRVRITDTVDALSPWSETASFTIGSTVPSTPYPISPVDTTMNSSDDIYFRWRFMDEFGYSQAKFDLEYKKGNEAAVSISVTSSTTIYILPKSTIGGGDYSWRVRCYNPFNELSPWTDWQNFYSIGKPEIPVITNVTNSMHPVITWQSAGQNLFRLKLYQGINLIHDSGEQIADANAYTIPDFIDIGSYTVRLSVSNIYNLWSDETSYNFSVSFTRPQKPTIYGAPAENYSISLLVSSTTASNLIYRKGPKETVFSLIATLYTNTYNDIFAGNGGNQYYVRAVNGIGYNDSDVITVNLDFNGILLNDGTNYINLWKTLNADKRPSIALGKDQYLVQLNGRVYPLVQSTTFKSYVETHEYAIKISEFDSIKEMLEKDSLYYRNNKGYQYPVNVNSIQFSESELNYYVVTFTITRLEE
jgi:hypothetical protein